MKLIDILLEQDNWEMSPSYVRKEKFKDLFRKKDNKVIDKPKRMSKKKQTKAYLSQIENQLEPEQFERFMNVYNLSGKPKFVDPSRAKGLNKQLYKGLGDHSGVRAQYNALQRNVLGFKPIEDGDEKYTLDTAIAELPHALQWNKHDNRLRNTPNAVRQYLRFLGKDARTAAKGEDPYTKDSFDVDDEDGQRQYTTVKLIRDDIEGLL